MQTLVKLLTAALLAVSLLGTAGCTNTHGSPSMVDYSYVPKNPTVSMSSQPGIEAF